MTYTGPEKYPLASLAHWYQGTWGGDQMESNVCVWHTTEGRVLPDYNGGAVAPNLTVAPDMSAKALRWYQHFDIDRSSRALVNLSGGVETNTANVVQVELVGTCDPKTRDLWISQGRAGEFIYWPDAPDWALQGLADFVNWLHDNHDIKIESKVTWKAYPGSYGTNNGVRLSGAEWNGFYGHLGHEHVTENLHGDPGDLKFARIIQLALGGDMALSADDIKKIFTTDDIVRSPDDATDTNKFWTLASYLRETFLQARSAAAVKSDVAGVKADVKALSAKVDALATGGIDQDALAKKVADLLAKRLES
jgi:hypothetical protein